MGEKIMKIRIPQTTSLTLITSEFIIFRPFSESTKYITIGRVLTICRKAYIVMHHKTGAIDPINWCTMLTKKQLKVLQPFVGNMFNEYGQRELGRLIKERSNYALQLALAQFEAENIIASHKVGTSKRYRLNVDNDKTYEYLTLLKYEDLPKIVPQAIEIVKKEIEKYTLFYSLVIFGSYASGKQTKESDLDIAVIIQDKNYEDNLKIAKNTAIRKSILNLDIHIMTSGELLEMLVNKEPNLGKEIARKHRAIHNINIFYKIIRRAIENGLNY